MADWLKRVLDEADRMYEALPEWKKASADSFLQEQRIGEDDE
jgi:hypothetical protein